VVFFRYFAICRQQESEKKEETLEHLIVFRFCGERRGDLVVSPIPVLWRLFPFLSTRKNVSS
jgi:hypothetical protein